MYERVDVICQSWDISLAIPDGESMSSHQSEILAPIAQGGNSALNQYDANVVPGSRSSVPKISSP